jgi:two-component system chemotaxis response regulator CheB
VHGATKAAVVNVGAGKSLDALAHYSIVAIGGSAGGLTSVITILQGLPADFAWPILVVLHLHPLYISHAADILGRQTSLKVKDAQQHDMLQRGIVYLAPTDHHLLVSDGLVELSTTAAVNYSRPAIDRTFNSVVQAYGAKVIGVVLSGSGKDGSEGLRAIKQAGGFAIVEDPLTARFSAMPSAAVSASVVDCVLPLEQIAPLLVKLSGTLQGTAGQ